MDHVRTWTVLPLPCMAAASYCVSVPPAPIVCMALCQYIGQDKKVRGPASVEVWNGGTVLVLSIIIAGGIYRIH